MAVTYMELHLAARRLLLETEGDHAGTVARELLAAAAGKTVDDLLKNMRYYAPDPVNDRLDDYVRRYLAGEPLAYIIGQWDFHGMTLTVTPDVLIPRDDTEAVTQLAVHRIKLFPEPNPRVLDLCAGTGCIGMTVAQKVRDARVTCGEVSQAALKILRKNITDQNLTGRVTPLLLDARKPAAKFLGQFDLIVSNPPYVRRDELAELPASVKDYEPALALDGGEDGLDFYRLITANFTPALKPGGWLCFEFGMGQQDDVCRILLDAGYEIEEVRADSGEIPRAVAARLPEKE